MKISTHTIEESMRFKGITQFTRSCGINKHVKNASIERYHKGDRITDLDIHSMPWKDRVILDVIAYDMSAGRIIVRNCNGIEWISDVDKYVFCNKDGSIQQ